MLKNVNEVNREPAHSEWGLVHVTFDQTELSCNTSIQMVKSRDLADHSNTGHFGPQTGFFQSGFQTTI